MTLFEYVKYFFGQKVNVADVPVVRRIIAVEIMPPDDGDDEDDGTIAIQNRLIGVITWALVFVLLFSLYAVFYFPAKNVEAPEIFDTMIKLIIGYFGGVFASYFGVKIEPGA